MVSDSNKKPVFLLGVGAQKGGTTWLWTYLKRHPQCAIGDIKEYAIFDALLMPDTFRLRRRTRLKRLSNLALKRLAKLEKGQEPDDPSDLITVLENVLLELDPNRYSHHFKGLLRDQPDTRLVADITPEYCALSVDDYTSIRDMLKDAGFDVRVVYLMRDPVERCYSMVRMGDRNAKRDGKSRAMSPSKQFAAEATSPWCEIRTRYDDTVTRLEQVFTPDEIFFDFYERFISIERVRALTDFLGLDFVEPKLDFRANASPRNEEPDPVDIAKVRAHYDGVYRFCKERFGTDLIDSLWRHA